MSFDFEKRNVKRNKRGLIPTLLLCAVVAGAFSFFTQEEKVSHSTHARQVLGVENLISTASGDERAPDVPAYTEYIVSEGDLPADVFLRIGKWSANDTMRILSASEDMYDFTNLTLGKKLRFFFEEGEKASKMEYYKDTETVITCSRLEGDFSCSKDSIVYEVDQTKADISIDTFFYTDALESGMSEATILDLADIFSYAIDFSTEIQQGDSSRVLYEKRYREGEKGPDGTILAARFVNSGKQHAAYYFEHEGASGYYDEEGREIVRQFLKAPLNFRRISSGFTGARLHPITKKVSAHYQIDYAAATGTPVVSTARGTIVSAGWEGGWGNMVRVRHDNGYTTHYGHLSAFAKGIRSGESVSQGQVIGYVGSTGWSTGPHLDYGMKLNGTPVNPLTLEQPKGPLLEGELLEQFWKKKSEYDALL